MEYKLKILRGFDPSLIRGLLMFYFKIFREKLIFQMQLLRTEFTFL